MQRTALFIGGEWVPAASGQYIPVEDPATGEVIAQVARGRHEDVDRAVEAARRAFPGWWRMAAADRGRLLRRLSDLIASHAEELAELESRDTGKPISQARADVQVAARYFEYYAGAADKLFGETIPYQPGYVVATFREPYGVTGHIIPWNYPIQIGCRTVAPALAVGNCVVMKPAEEACLSLVRLMDLAREAGFPPGVINLVTGYGPEAGAALAEHPGIDHLSFTGSVETGSLVMQASARHVRPVVLELGGKSPQIVLADADLDQASDVIVRAIVQNAGQTCSAGSRVLVESRVHDDLVDRLREKMSRLRVGPGLEDPDLGPVVSATQLERVLGYIEKGKAAGAEAVVGGRRLTEPPLGRGYFVAPTLFVGVSPDVAIANEEIFGPVLSVLRFHHLEEAVELANATPYGLVAGVWSRDISRALTLAGQLRCGQVFINNYGAAGGVELPFGGYKKSGFGREKGFEALYTYSQVKTVAVKL